MKRIGLDLDGVSFDFVTPFKNWLEKKYNRIIDYEDITDYYWYNCFDWMTKKDFWSEFHKFGKENRGYANLDFYKDAYDGINSLMRHHDVFILTNRPEYAYDDTVNILKDIFDLPRDKIIFSKGTKSIEVSDFNLDVFIDDAKHNVLDIAINTNARTYIMDQPYNRDFIHEKVRRVYNWHDFLDAEEVRYVHNGAWAEGSTC